LNFKNGEKMKHPNRDTSALSMASILALTKRSPLCSPLLPVYGYVSLGKVLVGVAFTFEWLDW